MPPTRKKSQEIRTKILEEAQKNPSGLAARISQKFSISRQAVSRHIRALVKAGELIPIGRTQARQYVRPENEEGERRFGFELEANPAEDVVWSQNLSSYFESLPENVYEIWQHGFTEMFNNVIDHSEGQFCIVTFIDRKQEIEMRILDDGVGIFNKIAAALKLEDIRHAALELSKGKLTTSPLEHSGEGIFFTSRMFDQFFILSGGLTFSHNAEVDFDIADMLPLHTDGTFVSLTLEKSSTRTTKEVFDQFSSEDDYSFVKTMIPMRLAEIGNDKLVSRSQAKRVLSGLSKFQIIVFDFSGVETIGQAFADQIFRVFANQNQNISIREVSCSDSVKKMIQRARANSPSDSA